VRCGKVRYLGCSNFTVAQLYQSQWAAQNIGGTGFISLQPHYSLLARSIEAEILPACEHLGLGAITYGPLASGLLAGRYRKGDTPEPGTRMHQWMHYDNPAAGRWVAAMASDRNHAIASEVTTIAVELGVSAAMIALAWIAGRPHISSVILGPRTPTQFHDNLSGIGLELPDEILRRLDDISQPPNAQVTGIPIAQPR
jgi:aryl-alcohol dehydrogenase-like predicted oxidoreductase